MDFKKQSYLAFILFVIVINASVFSPVKAHESGVDGLIFAVEQVSQHPDQAGVVAIKVLYTNITDDTIYFQRRGTALDNGIFENLLRVELDGIELPYVGPIFKRLKPTASDTISIAPQQTLSKVVEIQDAYSFSRAGLYNVTARQPKNRKSKIPQTPVQITVAFDSPELKRPPSFRNCSDSQKSAADNALLWAERYAIRARDAMSNTPEGDRARSPRYREWFGSYELGRWNRVQNNFNKIASTLSDRVIAYDCSCDAPSIDQSDTVAYVYSNRPYEVNLCPLFFRYRATGTNSQAGIVVHEVSHFTVVSGTRDHVYGTSGSKSLARRSPGQAIENADSYEYFAENPGNLSMSPSANDSDPEIPGEPIDGPIEEPTRTLKLMPILSLLMSDEQSNAPDDLLLPDYPEPVLDKSDLGKIHVSLNVSGGIHIGALSLDGKYQYSQLNSNFYANRFDPYNFHLALIGFGVTGNGLKTDDEWEFSFRMPNGSKFVRGVYENVVPFGGARENGWLRIRRYGVSPFCLNDKFSQRIRVYEAVYRNDFLHKLELDFSMVCDSEPSQKIEGSMIFDSDQQDASPSTFVPLESEALPALPLNGYGASIMIESFEEPTDSQPVSAQYYGVSELMPVSVSASSSNVSLNFNSPDGPIKIHFRKPDLDVDRFRSISDLTGRYVYLLGNQPITLYSSPAGLSPVGKFEITTPSVSACPSSVSTLDIHDLKKSTNIERLHMSFDVLCQSTQERTRGTVLVDYLLTPSP